MNNSSVVHAPSILPTNTPVLRARKDISKRIYSKCADGDIRAALRLLTSEDTVSDKSEETLLTQSVHLLLMEWSYLLTPWKPPSEAYSDDADNVLAAVNSIQSGRLTRLTGRASSSTCKSGLASGSGAGLSGMRPLHLQQRYCRVWLSSPVGTNFASKYFPLWKYS